MKPGLQGMSGHYMERRPCKGKNWRDQHWDDDKKEWIDDGPAKFFYCTQCEKFAWGWPAVCEKKEIDVWVPGEAKV